MHTLEPYYAWRNHYVASNDPRSPFFDRTYSEFEYSTKVYNYFIHPQWDSIHSPTLFCKILFVDYDERCGGCLARLYLWTRLGSDITHS